MLIVFNCSMLNSIGCIIFSLIQSAVIMPFGNDGRSIIIALIKSVISLHASSMSSSCSHACIMQSYNQFRSCEYGFHPYQHMFLTPSPRINPGKAGIGFFPIGFMCSMIVSFEQITTIRHVHITAIGFIILIGFIVIRLTNSISVNCRFMEWCFINNET